MNNHVLLTAISAAALAALVGTIVFQILEMKAYAMF